MRTNQGLLAGDITTMISDVNMEIIRKITENPFLLSKYRGLVYLHFAYPTQPEDLMSTGYFHSAKMTIDSRTLVAEFIPGTGDPVLHYLLAYQNMMS